MSKKIILLFIKNHKISSLILIISIIASVILSLLPPLLLKYIIDYYLNGKQVDGLFLVAVLYFSLFLAIGFFDIITSLCLSHMGSNLLYQTRKHMMKSLHNFSYKTLTSKTPAELEIYYSNDVSSINLIIIDGIVSLVINFFKVIGIIVSIFILSRYFGFISLFIVILISFIVFFVLNKMSKCETENRDLTGNVNSIVLETINNIKSIKIYSAKEYILKKYRRVLVKYFNNQNSINFFDSSLSPLVIFFEHSVIIIFILVFGLKVNSNIITLGALAGIISYMTNLFDPIIEAAKKVQTIQYSLSGLKRIDNYFNLEKRYRKNISRKKSNSLISVKNMGFSYDSKTKIFENFNLEIDKGEKIMITGISGVGKTTLLKLLYGLLSPNTGSIKIDNIDPYFIDESNRRKTFGILFQEPFFSGDSVRNELSVGKSFSNERIMETLRLCGLEDKFKNLDTIIDTESLSSGEKALFNLCRLLLFDSDIIFLDEVNSHIDNITYKKIVEIVNKKFENKTIISINHYGFLIKGVKVVEIKKY